jgi:hypothetical protein
VTVVKVSGHIYNKVLPRWLVQGQVSHHTTRRETPSLPQIFSNVCWLIPLRMNSR